MACIIGNKTESEQKANNNKNQKKSSRSSIGIYYNAWKSWKMVVQKVWRKFVDICSLSVAFFMVIKIVESLIIDSLAEQSSTELKKKKNTEIEMKRNNDDASTQFMSIIRIEIEHNVWCWKIHFHWADWIVSVHWMSLKEKFALKRSTWFTSFGETKLLISPLMLCTVYIWDGTLYWNWFRILYLNFLYLRLNKHLSIYRRIGKMFRGCFY